MIKQRHISLSFFSQILYYGIFILSFVLFIVLMHNTIRLKNISDKSIIVTSQLMKAQEDAFLFNSGSDYLTNQAHYFTESLHTENLTNYFTEINTTRRREGTLTRAKAHSDINSLSTIQAMLKLSKSLEKVEFYALALTVSTLEIPENHIPDEIKETQILDEDLNLSFEERRKKARQMVFGHDYQIKKYKMKEYLMHFYDIILDSLSAENKECLKQIKHLTLAENIEIFLLFFSVAVFFTLSKILHNKHKILEHKNKTDPLTGTYNREAFNKKTDSLYYEDNPVYFLMIDLDSFKSINDKYGHDAGDKVLQRTVQTIKLNFREQDRLYRIGGDEFAMIITDFTEDLGSLLIEKCKTINATLKQKHKEIPGCTLSIGIAYSPKGFTQKLAKQADIALYQAKRAGKGCAVMAAHI